MYKLLKGNPHRAQLFCESAGKSLETFTYYSSRPYSIVKDHLKNFILEENGEYVAYGHLDLEDGILWLGICVSYSHLGKGLGDKMMEHLIREGHQLSPIIKLSVNKGNKAASNLYNKLGFVITDETDKMYFMELKRNG
tara:strand:+ start:232 stop:645 length:414 start_codon:yes stop_codon:yes gene_type:complete